jgi:diaminohydroxyphosphoribosylaminopyrimidine deaminase / 5-amino-6-(5-phosphoribosylamino)uracil reductase
MAAEKTKKNITAGDEQFMRLALREAVKGIGFASPNPLVGAVAVKHGKLLAKAYHKKFGAKHAEIALIEKLTPAQTRGATIYVNLEPCCHVGKTPPCSLALISAQVKRVVVGHVDPNPLISGKGIAQLKRAGIEVDVGVLEEDARKINAPFLTYITQKRPWILLKVAQSLDGRIALANGHSRWITGEKARVEVHRLRSQLDAVMVGSQTVIEDDPELTVRHIHGRNPLRIIIDSMLRISPQAKILHEADRQRTWIIHTPQASAKKQKRMRETGATLLSCPAGSNGKVNLQSAMELLAQQGVTSVFVEGGGTLHASFMRAGLYDKFIVAIAPKVIGADGKPAIWELGFTELTEVPQFRVTRSRHLGEDLWLELEPDVHRNR